MVHRSLFLLDPITPETMGSITVNAAAVFLQVSNASSLPVILFAKGLDSVLTVDSRAEIYAGNTLFLGAQTFRSILARGLVARRLPCRRRSLPLGLAAAAV